MMDLATTLLLFFAFAGFALRRGLTYMHLYQQEEYDSPRFFGWMIKHKAFDKRLSLLILIISGATLYFLSTRGIHAEEKVFFSNAAVILAMALITFLEKDPRKNSKKKLVMTNRAKRIFIPAYLLMIVSAAWVFLPIYPPQHYIWIVNIQLIPVMIILVNLVLSPFEERTQKKFWNEAHDKVQDYQPKVIGITGSFGKTSVKHILGHILKTQAPTLITPGSVNTPMGIARVVREELEPEHQYLVVEMGAYGPGSIERLCRLTPPDMGIITAIGHAHYERFKSLETVAKTKYELAEAALEKGGSVIAHERTLRFAASREIKEQNENQFVICGEGPEAVKAKGIEEQSYLQKGDLAINSIIQKDKGVEVRFSWKNVQYSVDAPIFGVHHGHNIALAFAAAFELGIPSADIQSALQSLPQIQHRLEVKRQGGGITIIDDAYNSNPVGFQAALGLLEQMPTGGRKILVTPGMVELGAVHSDAHKTIGEYAAKACDIAIIVQGKRIPTFIDAYKNNGGKELHQVNTFAEAQTWISKNAKSGDVILLENDLPDLYERVPKF
ncbi:MAG: UDP-N-acetylmuramoyl-tripeptide--D-alanyl-D-alanine ligase [Alphaproteobacteria bacterium]|nr:UDP-N-acetylmuramoyl-tripeptide--D-alanyl-D-alanine ligase [Alphaproteobacteria bacterium]